MSTLKIGDRVIMVPNMDATDVIQGTVTKLDGDYAQLDNKDLYYKAFIFPQRVMEELIDILTFRAQIKEDLQESIKLIYDLRNEITRGEK